MANFWERAAHSVNHMFSLLYLFVVLVVSHLGFEGGNLNLIAPFPGHCLPFTAIAIVFMIICHMHFTHLTYFSQGRKWHPIITIVIQAAMPGNTHEI